MSTSTRVSTTLWKIAAILTLVVAVAAAELVFDVSSRFDSAAVESWLAEAGPLAPLAFILLMAAAIVVSPIPSLPLDILAGSFFGPITGAFYAVVGATIGATTSFLIARALGRSLLSRHLKGHISFCTRCSDRLLLKVVLVSRLIPFVSFDLVSYGAGLTRMSLPRFSIATAIGMVPLTLLYTSVGATALENRPLALVGGAVMVALFFLLPRWIERYDLFSMRRHFEHSDDSEQHAAESALVPGGSRDS